MRFASLDNPDSEGRTEGQAGLCTASSTPASVVQALPMPELVDEAVQRDDIITVSITD